MKNLPKKMPQFENYFLEKYLYYAKKRVINTFYKFNEFLINL